MNKIIPAISVIVLCSCATKQIKTPDVSIKTGEATKSALELGVSGQDPSPAKPISTVQSLLYKRHLIANRPFRHHTVIPVNKPVNPVEPLKKEPLIPRIARYIKQGIASWYGPRFHGKKTATGEIFDMYAMTAAHKTLPIPSYAQVTNLENNRSVIVRINDRGPFVGNRLLDLSYAAAKKLDIHKDGTGKVEVKALTDGQASPELANNNGTQDKIIYLQIGTFNNPEKAQKLQDKIAAHHLPEPKILPSTYKNSTLYKVQIGPIKSQSGAEKLTEKLVRLGISGTQFITETKQSQPTMIQ